MNLTPQAENAAAKPPGTAGTRRTFKLLRYHRQLSDRHRRRQAIRKTLQ
jgi:hypothetical protein